jgi:hypothetical protein
VPSQGLGFYLFMQQKQKGVFPRCTSGHLLTKQKRLSLCPRRTEGSPSSSVSVAGREADVSELQSNRERACLLLAAMGFVTACSMETTRRRTGEPNRHPIWLPALPIMDPHLRLGSTCLAQTQKTLRQHVRADAYTVESLVWRHGWLCLHFPLRGISAPAGCSLVSNISPPKRRPPMRRSIAS